MPQTHALSEGSIAPDFTLASVSPGEPVHLYTELERSTVVLFFYLHAFTPVCMTEVCSFRDRAADFQNLNSAVFGVSSDGESLTRRFAGYHRLPFPLLLDPGNRVRSLFRVPKVAGFLPGRSTFVIGQDRRILHVSHSALDGRLHANESLASLRTAAGSPK